MSAPIRLLRSHLKRQARSLAGGVVDWLLLWLLFAEPHGRAAASEEAARLCRQDTPCPEDHLLADEWGCPSCVAWALQRALCTQYVAWRPRLVGRYGVFLWCALMQETADHAVIVHSMSGDQPDPDACHGKD
jgi:hypothetical protein